MGFRDRLKSYGYEYCSDQASCLLWTALPCDCAVPPGVVWGLVAKAKESKPTPKRGLWELEVGGTGSYNRSPLALAINKR